TASRSRCSAPSHPTSAPPSAPAWPGRGEACLAQGGAARGEPVARPARLSILRRVSQMANIVVGVAASHSPQLSTPAELWRLHAERDRQNKQLSFRGSVYDYDQLLEVRKGEHFERELDDAIWAEKHDRCDRGIDRLAE